MNGDGAIDMNVSDREGANAAWIKFVWRRNKEKDLILGLEVMGETAKISMASIIVDYGLSAGAEKFKVMDDWDQKEHVR